MSGIFAFLTQSIDSALNAYVTNVSSNLTIMLAPVVTLGLSIHYTLLGLAVVRGETTMSLPTLAWSATKHTMIFAIALSVGAYQEWIVDTTNDVTSLLVQAVSIDNATSLVMALDQMEAKGSKYAIAVVEHGLTLMPLGGWIELVAGVVIMVSNLVLGALIGIWGILAKVALTFVLALGPLFISLLAFPVTKKYFDAWLGKVLNYVLLAVLMSAVTTFELKIVDSFVSQMLATVDESNAFSDSFGFALLALTLIVLTWQMPNIAAGIAGGAAVSSPSGWLAAAVAMTRRRGGESAGSPPQSERGGGSLSQASTGTSNSSDSRGSAGRIPAYRRATLDRLNSLPK